MKLTGNDLDLITLYKAPMGNDGILKDQLQALIDLNRTTFICGDFNMCFIDNKNCRTTKNLLSSQFKQLVEAATHIDGGHIDQAYLRSDNVSATVEIHSPYFTANDHDALCILIEDNQEKNSQ